MNRQLLLAASAGAAVFAGAGVGVTQTAPGSAAAFVSPVTLAQSVCGRSANVMRERRAFFLQAATAWAETGAVGAEKKGVSSEPVTRAGIAYKITTSSPAAQGYFDEGLAHMWNFNHGAAIAAFKKAQDADPNCAMCHWGEALAYGPNINAPMDDASTAPAAAATRAARARAASASDTEKSLIAALEARYERPLAMMERHKLDEAFADRMDAIAKSHPNDDFIAALAAEAMMDTQPWDYWELDGRTPKGRTGRAIELIEQVLDRNPDHIAAIHLYIHLTEATADPFRAVQFADNLDDLAPGLGHLIHMPSHTYYRIGRFKDSMDVNVRAALADEAFIAEGSASPFYEFGYYVHNVHFLMAAALMAGDGETAIAMAKKLDAKLPVEMALAVPFAQPIKAAPYYAMATFAAPEDVLSMPEPDASAPFLVGIWRYARGEALAKAGRAREAATEADRIAAIADDNAFKALIEVGIPAMDILRIAELTVRARAAAADDDLDTAIAAMELAVDVQARVNYTEPPYWYYPARQTLAALILRKGDAARAEQMFMATLVEAPNSGWAYFGLAEALRAQGDKPGRKYAEQLHQSAWLGGKKDRLTLSKL
ncbi:MAG: hypothetical protein GC152_13425 [Alphaproteobacteria bacterium]|nr:hypothetical protein [Alphaproteobacteria bacterium]